MLGTPFGQLLEMAEPLLEIRKQVLRKQMKRLISLVTVEQANEESISVFQKILRYDWLKEANRISIYVSTEGELSTDRLITYCLSLQKKVYIPRFKRGEDRMEMLRLHSFSEYQNLDRSLWGIRQHHPDMPVIRFHEDAKPEDGELLDIVFMPGLAFTKRGDRLGRGKGFYDKFLDDYQKNYGHIPFLVGLALRTQIVHSLPVAEDGHDVPLDLVLHA